MAIWLGKIGIQKNDLPEFFKERNKLTEFYINDMKFRLVIKLDLNELREFEKAVINKYGKFSALNSRKAASDAIKNWINNNLDK